MSRRRDENIAPVLRRCLLYHSRRPLYTAYRERGGRSSSGTLEVIDNAVNPDTGMIGLKAVFDNRNGLLWPGQFVNVVLTLDTRTAAVVPAEAIHALLVGRLDGLSSDTPPIPRVTVRRTASGV
jgi:multidrug efflux pump subunit AcrA (membrane-fusion protein)